jgi:peptidyl-prolyl cis-trans isomerase SurA
VLERQETNDTGEFEKNKAREEIFKRKVEEETELWLRRIREEAYVEIRL